MRPFGEGMLTDYYDERELEWSEYERSWAEFRRKVVDEIAAAHAAMDVKESELDEHGYGGEKPVDPTKLTGLAEWLP